MEFREPTESELRETPEGFRFGATHCGLKTQANALDLSVVVCECDAVATGVYTQNRVVAAPVVWDQRHTPSSRIRAVVANSGNANACTGDRGMADARAMAQVTATELGVDESQVLVLSTGIIGEYLPMEKLQQGIPQAVACADKAPASLIAAAQGIMTTDRVPKIVQQTVECESETVRITGIAKGAGMIGPRMATMLGVLTTDAKLTPDAAGEILRRVVDRTFNCISVEGHTSTNDTVLLLASGKSGVELTDDSLARFEAVLDQVARDLARQIPADGEGASHLITIRVNGAPDRDRARLVARTVADSPLVKTAVTGADPNWGRIVSAAGYAGVPFAADQLRLAINGVCVFDHGMPTDFDRAGLSASMKETFEVTMELELGAGSAGCTFWTSDLTHEYITINADYHT